MIETHLQAVVAELEVLQTSQALLSHSELSLSMCILRLQPRMRALQAGELLLPRSLAVQVLLEGAVRSYGRPVVRLQLAQPRLQGLRLGLRM